MIKCIRKRIKQRSECEDEEQKGKNCGGFYSGCVCNVGVGYGRLLALALLALISNLVALYECNDTQKEEEYPETAHLLVIYAFNTIHTLDAAQTLLNGVQTLCITHIEAQFALKDAIVRLDVHLAHIDAEIVGNHICKVYQYAHTVDADNLDCDQRRLRLELRPLYSLLYDALAVL